MQKHKHAKCTGVDHLDFSKIEDNHADVIKISQTLAQQIEIMATHQSALAKQNSHIVGSLEIHSENHNGLPLLPLPTFMCRYEDLDETVSGTISEF